MTVMLNHSSARGVNKDRLVQDSTICTRNMDVDEMLRDYHCRFALLSGLSSTKGGDSSGDVIVTIRSL